MKAIIFDMDGVLIESMKYHILSWKKAFNEFGINATEKELYLYEGMSFKKTIDIIVKENNLNLSDENKNKIYSEKKKQLGLCPEIQN